MVTSPRRAGRTRAVATAGRLGQHEYDDERHAVAPVPYRRSRTSHRRLQASADIVVLVRLVAGSSDLDIKTAAMPLHLPLT
jgi:hypothetical protein